MHLSSREKMDRFAELCSFYFNKKISIIDIGGVGDSYRNCFENKNISFEYNTLNVKLGNVWQEDRCNILVQHPYNWTEISDGYYDVVICGQVFEHIEYFWVTILEIRRILKNGGLTCIIAPSHWEEHRVPYDTFRYYADGMNAIAKFAGLEILYSGAEHPAQLCNNNKICGDAFLIAKKREEQIENELKYKNAHLSCLDILKLDDIYEISRNKPVFQSSHDHRFEHNNSAVSNLFTGEYSFHTRNEQSPFYIINLESTCCIKKILIFNRKHMEDRASDIDIAISSDFTSWEIIHSQEGYFGGIYDGCPLEVSTEAICRYVKIQKRGYGILHLDQIQIFGYRK